LSRGSKRLGVLQGTKAKRLNLRDVKFEADELMHAYVQALDDGRYEEWPEFFTDEALYKIIARDNFERNLPLATMFCAGKAMMKDRVVALCEACVYSANYLRHLVSAVRVSAGENDGYIVQSNYVVFSTAYNEETKVFNAGRYMDEIVFIDGIPKLRKKIVVYDTLQIPSLLAIPI